MVGKVTIAKAIGINILYIGIISFVINDSDWPSTIYLSQKQKRVFFNENAPIRIKDNNEEKLVNEFNEVVDFLHFNFKL